MAVGLTRRGLMCACGCFTACLAFRAEAAAAAQQRPEFEFSEMTWGLYEEVGYGVYVHTSWSKLPTGVYFPSNGIVVTGPERVLMIDTAWTPDQTETLLERVKPIVGGRPIDLFITHFHDDRMGGIGVTTSRGIESHAFERTVQEAARVKAGRIDHTLPSNMHTFDLGGRLVEVFYPGPGHTIDNAVAYDRDLNIVFGGCMIRAAATTDLGNTADAVIADWGASVAKVAAQYPEVAIVVPGHGKLGGAELFAHTMELAKLR